MPPQHSKLSTLNLEIGSYSLQILFSPCCTVSLQVSSWCQCSESILWGNDSLTLSPCKICSCVSAARMVFGIPYGMHRTCSSHLLLNHTFSVLTYNYFAQFLHNYQNQKSYSIFNIYYGIILEMNNYLYSCHCVPLFRCL